MDIESNPLIIGTERVFVLGLKPVTGKLIDFGSELKCQEVLANLTSAKLRKVEPEQFDGPEQQRISELEQKVEKLQNELEDCKSKLQSSIKKCEKYKHYPDCYHVMAEIFDRQRAGSTNYEEQGALIDSTELIPVDMAHPTVQINKAQKNVLSTIPTGGMAARALVDMLFEEEEYHNQNCKLLEKDHPEKIKAIRAYVMANYEKFENGRITKAITGKCSST